jgi:hypothetical protein
VAAHAVGGEEGVRLRLRPVRQGVRVGLLRNSQSGQSQNARHASRNISHGAHAREQLRESYFRVAHSLMRSDAQADG